MENAKKQLKSFSILVLILAAFSLARTIIDLFLKDSNVITLVITVIVGCLVLLPQIFIGYRGMKVAKNPDSKKGFIVWSWILLVLAGIGVISSVVSLFNSASVLSSITSIADNVLDLVTYFAIIYYANIVQKGA